MACQFLIFVIFCCSFNMFSCYYIVIFCNIYEKSVNSLMQSVFLSLFLDIIVFESIIPILLAGIRAIIKLDKIR